LPAATRLSRSWANSLSYLGYAYAQNKQYDKVRIILEEMEALSKEKYVAAYLIASVYVGLGEYEKALDLLERAYEERNEFFVFLNSHAVAWPFEPLFSHPRYLALLRKAGFRD
jgi:adenylate cyclase